MHQDAVKGGGPSAGWRTTPKPSRPRIRSGPAVGSSALRHLARDGVEGGADLRAQEAGGADDANCDQSCDEAVLDRRGARLVLHETCNEVLHDNTPTDSFEACADCAVSVHPLGHSTRAVEPSITLQLAY